MTIYTKPNFSEAFGTRGSHGGKLTESGLMHKANVWQFLTEARGEQGYQHIAEALSTSDFDYLLTSDMNAQLLAQYQRDVPSYTMWTRGITVPDFKTNPLPYLDAPVELMGKIQEKEEFKYTYLDDGQYTIKADTYARGLKLTKQAIVNDALGAFRNIPTQFSQMAAMTVEKLATQQIADVDGPDATLFTSGHNNLITSELSYAALEEAWNAMAAQTDDNSLPIYNRPKGIIVPKELEPLARRLISAMQVETLDDTNGFRTTGDNMFANLEIAVNPWITSVSSDNTYKAKQWYMYADPNVGRPTVAVATLQGAPNARIFSKAPDAILVGGGSDPYSFKDNALEWKVQWDLGFSQIDYRGMVASKPAA